MKRHLWDYWPLLAVAALFGGMIAFDAATGNINTGACHGFPWFLISPCN